MKFRIWIAAALGLAGSVRAQSSPADTPPQTPAPEIPAATPSSPPTGLPSLDELLGIIDESTPAPTQPERPAMDDRPAARDPREQLRRAAESMDRAAARLTDQADASLPTQRLQEEALRTLDALIDQANRNRSQGGSSSGGQSPSSSQPAPAQPQSQREGRQGGGGQGEQEGLRDDSTEVRAGQAPAGGAEWGRLPERLRDALTQGVAERSSSLYERATRDYYRRLAEEVDR